MADAIPFTIGLITHVKTLLSEKKKRISIGISGICGSGKSTMASSLLANLTGAGFKAELIPLDGYHYSKEVLSRMENSAEAQKRRGAHWTFDGNAFVALIKNLQNSKNFQNSSIEYANGWSHKIGDPLVDAISIDQSIQVLIIEGLHLFLDFHPWKELDFDVAIWIDVELETAMTRLAKRHVDSGISRNEEEAKKRVAENDVLNARFLLQNTRTLPDLFVFKV
jgi:pantothenate kinase